MPLQERNEEIEKAFEALNFNKENIKSKSKQKHCFYAILAGTGSGKSRLSDEILHRIEDKYPTDTYCVRIDFSNGDKIQPSVESNYPTHMLGLRVAARLLFNCSTADLIGYLSGVYELVPFDTFGFNEVMAAFYEWRTQLTGDKDIVKMVLVMDEINYVTSVGDFILNEMLAIIGNYMCVTAKARRSKHLRTQNDLAPQGSTNQNPASTHRLALLPVICGTIVGSLQSEFIATGYKYILGAVRPLSNIAIENIFTSIHPDKKAWLNNEIFASTLKLLGRIPRCMEHIIEVCQKSLHPKKLTDEMAKDVAEKAYGSISSLYLV